MNSVVGHIASGQSFFSGSVLLLVCVYGMAFTNRSRWSITGMAIGLILIAVSSTPLGLTYYSLLALAIVGLVSTLALRERNPKAPKRCAIALFGIMTVGIGLEANWHMLPHLDVDPHDKIFIFGDSLTAGIGDEATTWPKLFTEASHLEVSDHSRVGARVSTMIEIARHQDLGGQVVVLEIGGNDILLGTSASEFHARLDESLANVSNRAEHVVMFELPLPPFFHSFGSAQRNLAKKYQVTLIPKHVLMGVLTTGDSTLDSIHLSTDGHRVMAEQVGRIIRRCSVGGP